MNQIKNFILFTLFTATISITFSAYGQDYDIGTSSGYFPFEFIEDQNLITGFDIELIDAVSEKANFTYNLIDTKWSDLLGRVTSGEVDAAIAAISITDERKQVMDFSIPYIRGGLVIFTHPDNSGLIQNKEDLDGQSIGVIDGSYAHTWLSENTQAFIVPCSSRDEEFNKLGAKEVYALVDEGTVTSGYLKINPQIQALLVNIILVHDELGIAVYINNTTTLLEDINKALKELKNDGTYDAIYTKWFKHDLFKMKNYSANSATIQILLLNE
jgi:ABC-type amino acid transport substrate-binding protein